MKKLVGIIALAIASTGCAEDKKFTTVAYTCEAYATIDNGSYNLVKENASFFVTYNVDNQSEAYLEMKAGVLQPKAKTSTPDNGYGLWTAENDIWNATINIDDYAFATFTNKETGVTYATGKRYSCKQIMDHI